MRQLTHAGYGTIIQQADAILLGEVDKVWESGVISLDTAQGLSHGIYFYNLKCFGLRAGQIHRDLNTDQFTFKFDEKIGRGTFLQREII